MAATGKTSLAFYMVALIAQCVPTVTSTKVAPSRINRGIHQGNASRTSVHTQAIEPQCRPGSPPTCTVSEYVLNGNFIPGRLVRVDNGHDVYRSTDTNSCPDGWKIWAARNREDMATVINTVGSPPTVPHFIVDVTRPADGCGECGDFAMNSDTAERGSWVTTDESPWYLRGTPYHQPTGDYTANCYLGIFPISFTDADSVTFNDWECNVHSTAYLCQPAATAAPTPTPTLAPTVAPTPATATGDPHLQNIHGERFDLMTPGTVTLINIPRGKRVEDALFAVEAKARRLGGHCADMYFQTVNITGVWADKLQAGGFTFDVQGAQSRKVPKWMNFGPLEVKVVHGRTEKGIKYLNLFVKHLGHAGFAVGGLLGEDDHTDAARIPGECRMTMSVRKVSQTSVEAEPASVAIAS